jgi:phage shock protein E
VEGVLWTVALLGLIIGILAFWQLMILTKRVNQLKRDHYYTDSRVKRVPEEVRDTVHPLRVHLAKVASGGTVSAEMILQGRLYQEVSSEEARQVFEQRGGTNANGVLFLDVRTPKEYAARRVPGAKLVPFEELEARYKAEVPETADKVFVYCMSGERSRVACDFLGQRGYTNLYLVRDGLRGWQGPTEGEGELSLIKIQTRGGKAV